MSEFFGNSDHPQKINLFLGCQKSVRIFKHAQKYKVVLTRQTVIMSYICLLLDQSKPL